MSPLDPAKRRDIVRELKKRACPSCGAPLTPMPGGGGYTCPFCDTVLHWEETEPPVQDAKKRQPAPFVPPKPTVDPRKDWLADFQRADREVTIFPPTDPLRVSKKNRSGSPSGAPTPLPRGRLPPSLPLALARRSTGGN